MSNPRLPHVEHHLQFTDGPESEWVVLGLDAQEGLNCCYRAILDIETDDLELDLPKLLGRQAELAMQRGDHTPTMLFGVVSQVDYLGFYNDRLRLRVELVPAFALADQTSHSRIWQERSVQAIVREVLDENFADYDRSVAMDGLTRGVQPREYCVQYRETDFEFVCRLLEEEGIAWFFQHDEDAGHEILTLCDDNRSCPSVENLDGSDCLPIIAHSLDEADVEAVGGFHWKRRLTTTAAGRSDFDYAAPGAVVSAEHDGADNRGRTRRIWDHGQRRFNGDDLQERVRDSVEALAVAGSVATCTSNASLARPGCRFHLDGVESHDCPLEWIITAVHHSTGSGDGSGIGPYRNSFECVPADVPLRPLANTPKPRVQGPQTATVVGSGEIDVDASGRIQAQFHWQENPSFAAGASCRVRCAQSWAGPGWGAQFIPRVGMEVVVEFLEGNPDRPLVTGCVYNGAAEPPFALPANSTQSGWRTNSSPGGGGSNELRFEDAAGAEQIYIHGQKDWLFEINHNVDESIGNDSTLTVGHDRVATIVNDDSEEVGGHKSIGVAKTRTEAIGDSMALTVATDQSVTVGNTRSVNVGSDQSVSVGASATEFVTAAKTVTVGGALATIVGAAMNTSVGGVSGEEVAGMKSVSVGAASSEKVVGIKSVDAGSISQSSRGDISESAAKSFTASAGKDMDFGAGGNFSIKGKKKGLIELKDELTIKVGKASITLKKSGQIVLNGGDIDVKSNKDITLKAKKVNQN